MERKPEGPEKKVLIACSMIEDEINTVFDLFDIRDTEIRWQKRGHHEYPDKLNRVIQDEIDRAEADGASLIMLAYGLCGKGAEGWHTHSAVLAMPRFDDCINMMLCPETRERRNYEKAGYMYVTRGWTIDEGAILSMADRYVERYGSRKGMKVMKRMYDSYTKVAVIDTGCYPLEPVFRYAEKCAAMLGIESGIADGGNRVLEKLITGEWDDDILVKQPGEPVRAEDFDFEDQI